MQHLYKILSDAIPVPTIRLCTICTQFNEFYSTNTTLAVSMIVSTVRVHSTRVRNVHSVHLNVNRKELEINHASPKAHTRSIENTINENKAFHGVFPVCTFADNVRHRKRAVCSAAVANCNEMWIWWGFERKNPRKIQLNETPEGARKSANHSFPNASTCSLERRIVENNAFHGVRHTRKLTW